MKACFSNSVLAITLAATVSVHAAPAEKKSAAVQDAPIPKSTFGIPARPQEGHDPFFPNSDRLFAVKSVPKRTSGTVSVPVLVFNGYSGTQEHRLAMINGRTMAEGEEADVSTTSGRAKVRLVEIKGELAVVEVAGERRELLLKAAVNRP